jgi:hypothetical protein
MTQQFESVDVLIISAGQFGGDIFMASRKPIQLLGGTGSSYSRKTQRKG